MTSIPSGISLLQDSIREIDTGKLQPVRLTDAERQDFFDRMEKMLEASYSRPQDFANHPAYQSYATVEVNGKVVARIDNHGWASMSNSLGAKLSNQLPGDVNGQTGPVLAQKRAEVIAELLGGKVVKTGTALTQAEFNALPQPNAVVDYNALRLDPRYEALQKSKQAATEFRAQQIAQESDIGGTETASDTDDAAEGSAAVKKFLEYMAKTPEERAFEAFLKSNGLTEEQFEALPPEEKKALLKEFEEAVKQHVENEVNEQIAKTENIGPLPVKSPDPSDQSRE